MIKNIFFILLVFVTSCTNIKKKDLNMNKTNSQNIKTQTNVFQLEPSEYVILPFDQNQNDLFQESTPHDIKESELNDIERILLVATSEHNKIQEKIIEKHNSENPNNKIIETGQELNLAGFKRQYIAVMNKQGEKEIWINFFCDTMDMDSWKSDIFIVFDGGNCYYNLKINLTKNTYYDISINGEA